MSQWGVKRKVNGAKFMACVDTGSDPFQPIGQATGDTVARIILLDNGGDERRAETTLEDLKARFAGKPYSDWLAA
jgi:hypothetical protein